MPQVHKAGEKTFVDYSGLTVPIWSTNLQTISYEAEIFVGVLGASDLIFCMATQTQKIADWIDAHNKMFHYYGGATELVIPDNLRTGVTRPHRYEPQCQTTFEELAQHYDCAIMPARAYRPRDKAKVEKAVQLVQQRVLAPLRHQQFYSLTQLNEALEKQREDLNNRHSKAFGCTRWELFKDVEQSTLIPLPTAPYELAQWQQQQVNAGYHVQVKHHYYSVPYTFVRKKIDIRVTKNSIELFYQDERIACHVRDDTRNTYTTVNAHRPEAHRQQAQWQGARLQAWAQGIGAFTEQFTQQLLQGTKRHLHQKERSALGILRLSHAYGEGQLEQACEKALQIGTYRYDSLISILKRQQLVVNESSSEQSYQTPTHDNVRGSKYYH